MFKNHRPRFYDISAGLASHCSLHSCTSSDMGGNCGGHESSVASYSTSLSTDTLYWDPHTETSGHSRQQSTKSRQSYHHPQQQLASQQQQQQYAPHRYHLHTAQIQPISGYGCHSQNHQQYIQHKPKSWDNLAMKGYGGYGFGYGYLDTVGPNGKKQQPSLPQQTPITTATATTAKLPQPATAIITQQQQRHSIPRKNPYGRYSTFSDVENYAPPPSQFVQTITTTTITKSTENLLGTSLNHSDSSLHSCEGCQQKATIIHAATTNLHQQTASITAAGQQQHVDCMGYYSHLPRSSIITSTGTNSRGVATVSEVTRL